MFPAETFSRGTLDPWYVTGFVEGVGAFTFSRSGRQMALYFAIKLTGADKAILEDVRSFFDVGSIYKVIASDAPTPASGYTKEAAYYRVSRRDDLERITAHFDQYPLRGVKADAYRIWRQMVELKRAFRKPDREELDRLAAELSALSPRNQRRTND